MNRAVRVKICGLTNLEDALASAELGADAVGFVFADSPRRVGVSTVADITRKLPPFLTTVGVFVDSAVDDIRGVMVEAGLHIAQLHGCEGPEECEALHPRVVKSFTPDTLPSTDALAAYRVRAVLLDVEKGTPVDESARQALWELARSAGNSARVILAGGLTPDNVRLAVETAMPYAVDVSSGIEIEPGTKDHARMREFIENARAASRRGGVGTS